MYSDPWCWPPKAVETEMETKAETCLGVFFAQMESQGADWSVHVARGKSALPLLAPRTCNGTTKSILCRSSLYPIHSTQDILRTTYITTIARCPSTNSDHHHYHHLPFELQRPLTPELLFLACPCLCLSAPSQVNCPTCGKSSA